jgi:hypothetical protein
MESLDESNGFVYKNWRFCLLKLKQAELAEDKLLIQVSHSLNFLEFRSYRSYRSSDDSAEGSLCVSLQGLEVLSELL